MRFKRPNLMSVMTGLTAALLAGSAAMAAEPTPGGWWLQEPATPVMVKLTEVHNLVFWIICAIVIFVMVLMGYIMIRFREKANPVPSKTSHNTLIEVIWTIVPVLILLVIVVPSMQLLYYQDQVPETELTVKAVGNTWNWEYAYPDYENIESYISNPLDEDASEAAGKPFLLGTDAPLVVPVNTKVKVLVTSLNNMHAWTVPSFGIKMDAVPGLVNETWFEVFEEGTYYGPCSEICGVNHYYMPIEVQVVSKAEFERWVANDGAFPGQTAQLGGTTTAAQK